MHICSFLPSATEMVYALGLQDQLYGVTFECDYPQAARSKPIKPRIAVTDAATRCGSNDSLIVSRGVTRSMGGSVASSRATVSWI